MSVGERDVAEESKRKFEVVEYAAGRPGFQDASTYDQRRFGKRASNYKHTVMMRAILSLVGGLEGRRVLDVGCGTGRGIVRFSKEASFAMGTDYSLDMLLQAIQKTQQKSNCGFVRSVAQQLPFPDRWFDVVTALNFLHLFRVETQRAMIAEMKRVTKPGGTLVLEFDNAFHGVVVGLYKRWFRDERGSLPWEIKWAIGGNCRVVKSYGAIFPVLWRFMYRNPEVFIPFERIGYVWPFSHLLHRVYCKVIVD